MKIRTEKRKRKGEKNMLICKSKIYFFGSLNRKLELEKFLHALHEVINTWVYQT